MIIKPYRNIHSIGYMDIIIMLKEELLLCTASSYDASCSKVTVDLELHQATK